MPFDVINGTSKAEYYRLISVLLKSRPTVAIAELSGLDFSVFSYLFLHVVFICFYRCRLICLRLIF